MKVILHADDFGFNEDTVKATIECFNCGALTSASIMVNCEASQTAFEYAKENPQNSYGVHLTYVDGLTPVSKPETIKTLIDDNGKFLESNIIRKKALLLKLNRNEIIQETLSQINKLSSNGIKVSHLDSHGHLHKFPIFLSALNEIKTSFNNLKVRGVQNIFIIQKKNGLLKNILNAEFGKYIKRHFTTTDYFYMAANSFDKNWSENILKQMDSLPNNAVLEVGVHPGKKEEWRRNEFNDICKFANMIKNTKHEITNWNNL